MNGPNVSSPVTPGPDIAQSSIDYIFNNVMLNGGFATNISFSQGGAAGNTGLAIVAAQSAVPASVTGTATETALATIAIPPLLPSTRVRIRTWWSAGANNADTKTVNARLNGTLIATSGGLANNLSAVFDVDLLNRGALNVQLSRQGWSGPTGVSTSAFTAYAIDTSQTTSLTLTAQLGTTSDTVTLESYSVEFLNP